MKRIISKKTFLLCLIVSSTHNAFSMETVDPEIFDFYYTTMMELPTDDARYEYINTLTENPALQQALKNSLLDEVIEEVIENDTNDLPSDDLDDLDDSNNGNTDNDDTVEYGPAITNVFLKQPAPSMKRLQEQEKKTLGGTQENTEGIVSRVINYGKSFFIRAAAPVENNTSTTASDDATTQNFVTFTNNDISEEDDEELKRALALSLESYKEEKSRAATPIKKSPSPVNMMAETATKNPTDDSNADYLKALASSFSATFTNSEDAELQRILEESKEGIYLGGEDTENARFEVAADKSNAPREAVEWDTMQLTLDGRLMPVNAYQGKETEHYKLIQIESLVQDGAECGYMAFINNLILNKFLTQKLYLHTDYQNLSKEQQQPLVYGALPQVLSTLISPETEKKNWITNEGFRKLANDNTFAVAVATGTDKNTMITTIDESGEDTYIIPQDTLSLKNFCITIARNLKEAQRTNQLYLQHFIIDTNNYEDTQRELQNKVDGQVSTTLEDADAIEERKKIVNKNLRDGTRGHYFSFIVAHIPGNTKTHYIVADSFYNVNQLSNPTIQSLIQKIEGQK